MAVTAFLEIFRILFILYVGRTNWNGGRSSWSGLDNVRGGFTPRTGFPDVIGTEWGFICGFSLDETLLGRARTWSSPLFLGRAPHYKTLMMINLLKVVHTSQNFNLAIYFTLKMRKLAFFF